MDKTTAHSAKGFDCACCFVTDKLHESVLQILKESNVSLVALRSAGYNNVDLESAEKLELTILRVPAYSPHAVAEYAVGLLLCLNRKIHKAYNRVKEQNFSLEGLLGFDLHGKTVGVIGTGRIGSVFATIMKGFGCTVLAYDPVQNEELVRKEIATYLSLGELYQKSDVISLHVPLLPNTHHMINAQAFSKMNPGVILINTGRGGLIDSKALIKSLKSGHLGAAGLDVYEEEDGIFFKDLSELVLQDDVLSRLTSFPNVLLTSHQAFFTKEALKSIAEITIQNISDFEDKRPPINQVQVATHIKAKNEYVY